MTLRFARSLYYVLLFSWVLLSGTATQAQTTAQPLPAGAIDFGEMPQFPKDPMPLPPDPALLAGKLKNGLRYAVYPNKAQPGLASLRLIVLAGSLHETEEQRGLAHFLEHMAFSGSTHYPPGTLVEFFQRMGMQMGADSNARTGYDRTEYRLELPKSDAATLAEAFRVFSDYAGGLLLLDEEIERERGVILSEKREIETPAYRSNVASLEFTLGDSRFPKRMPIGEEAVIRSAGRAQLLDFWNTWYRPERMIVVAVGDFDPKKVEKQISKTFSPLKARAPAWPEPDLGEVKPLTRNRALYYYEPEAPSTTVRVTNTNPYALPWVPKEDGFALRMMDFMTEIAVSTFNRRLREVAKQEGAPFLTAGVAREAKFRFYREAALEINTTGEQWVAALAAGEQELRRAVNHGFRQDEINEARAEFLTAIETMAKNAGARRTRDLADEIAEALYEGRVFTHPHFDYMVYRAVLEKLESKMVSSMLALLFVSQPESGQVWSTKERYHYISVSGNAVIEAEEGKSPGERILAVEAASRLVDVEPLAERETPEWAYAHWGEPGEIVSDERVKNLDLRLIRFANGVRLNLKRTTFEPGIIRTRARVGEGRISEPTDLVGAAILAQTTFNAGGLAAHDTGDLGRIFAGRQGGSRFTVEDDAFLLFGETTPADFRLHLQALAAQLMAPGWRPEALRQASTGLTQMYQHFQHSADGILAVELPKRLKSGETMHGFPEKEVLLSRTITEVREWLGPQLETGPVELAVVGEFDPEEMIAAVAATLGALPPRAERRDLRGLRSVVFPAQPFSETYRIPTRVDKGEVRVYWPANDAIDARRGRQLVLLGKVLEDRLRVQVRQKLGASYNPTATVHASGVFEGYGYWEAACSVDPSKAQQVVELIVKIGDDLARNGVTKEEFSRAQKPLITRTTQMLSSNQYWLGVLSKAQERPDAIEDARKRPQRDIETITAAEISALAAEYLGAARASRVIIVPE